MPNLTLPLISKRSCRTVLKAWGKEEWVYNGSEYCGKLLYFNKNAKFSAHFHSLKLESWLVLEGVFILNWIDIRDASRHSLEIKQGDVVDIPKNVPHQLVCVEQGRIMEVSTTHFDSDSYRVEPGDSQQVL